MSILLDALRKSEQRERLGTTPDIHSSEPATDSAASQGRRNAILGGLVTLVVVLGAYGAWSWWSGSRTPAGTTDSAAATTAPASRTNAPAPVSGTVDDESAGMASAATAGAGSQRLSSQPRSPVENLSGDRPYRPAAAQSSTAAAPESQVPTRVQPEISDADLDAAVTQAASQAKARAEARARRQAARRAAQAPQPLEPDDGSISYWQLPENVRGGLPELKINVMVYDEDPARRFIIMGGKRFGEGDEVISRLTVESIERDRALFRYGAYLFFVKQ